MAKKRTVTKIQKLFQGPGFLKKKEKIQVNSVEVTNKNKIVQPTKPKPNQKFTLPKTTVITTIVTNPGNNS